MQMVHRIGSPGVLAMAPARACRAGTKAGSLQPAPLAWRSGFLLAWVGDNALRIKLVNRREEIFAYGN